MDEKKQELRDASEDKDKDDLIHLKDQVGSRDKAAMNEDDNEKVWKTLSSCLHKQHKFKNNARKIEQMIESKTGLYGFVCKHKK